MKFDIIVKDVSLEELPNLVSKLTGTASVQNTTVHASQPNVLTQSADLEEVNSSLDVTGQVDSEGLPWDARIHSSSKSKTGNGVWKAKRGRSDAEYAAVKAELLGSQTPAPAAPVLMTAPVLNQFANAPSVQYATPAMTTSPVIPVNHAPPELAAPVQFVQPVQEPNTFQSVANRMQAGFQRGAMTPDHITSLTSQLNQTFGTNINNITEIANSQPMIDKAIAILAQMGL